MAWWHEPMGPGEPSRAMLVYRAAEKVRSVLGVVTTRELEVIDRQIFDHYGPPERPSAFLPTCCEEP